LREGRPQPRFGALSKSRFVRIASRPAQIISILWKFEKANALPGHVVARLMALDIDPYEGVAPQLGQTISDGCALRSRCR
jgi:hypothetical protein